MSGTHESPRMGTDEWLTPPWLLRRLGTFDLDPCAPHSGRRPWPTARRHFCREDDGLNQPWAGRVWLNPPYGTQMALWLRKLAKHGNGIALIFARTDTAAFFESVWDQADAILFIRKRIAFHRIDGTMTHNRAGAASVLVAYGRKNVAVLNACADLGRFVRLRDPLAPMRGTRTQRAGIRASMNRRALIPQMKFLKKTGKP